MTAAREPRTTCRNARAAVPGNCRKWDPKFHRIHRRPQGCGNFRREDLRRFARQEGMLKLAVTLLFLFAIGAALSDLARGRRPLLLG